MWVHVHISFRLVGFSVEHGMFVCGHCDSECVWRGPLLLCYPCRALKALKHELQSTLWSGQHHCLLPCANIKVRYSVLPDLSRLDVISRSQDFKNGAIVDHKWVNADGVCRFGVNVYTSILPSQLHTCLHLLAYWLGAGQCGTNSVLWG